MQGHDVRALFQPVEHHHLGTHQLVHHQIAHIGVIGHDGGGVGEHDLLSNRPVLREAHIQVAHLLHTVQLGNHALRPVLFRQRLKLLGGDGLLIQGFQIHVLVGISGEIVLLFPFLKHQQQRPLAGVEALVLQRLLNELGLTGIQKAGKGIYGNLHHAYTPNSAATPASSSLEPMTQSLPVMSALPVRTLHSSGT